MTTRTFGSVFAAEKGFGPGFDFVRIALAMSILCYHSVRVTGGYDTLMASPGWIIRSSLVPMFFAVSGFLIAGSALRLKLSQFLTNRGLRIFPALAVEIAISALVIGAIVTSVPLKVYFTDSQFYSYFGNIVGWVHYHLPGVFLDAPYAPLVNASLWTIPYEFACYALISLIMLAGMLRKPWTVLLLTGISLVTPLVYDLLFPGRHDAIPDFIGLMMWGRGAGSVQCFLLGICLYLYRDRIPFNGWIAIAAAAVVVMVGLLGSVALAGNGILNLLIAVPLTYFILFVGLSKIPRVPFFHRGDYSYGVYLYGYPFQQLIVTNAPAGQSWWVNFLFAAVTVTVVAVVSWHMIEKPILLLRKKFSFVGRRIAEGEGGPEAAKLAVDTAVARP